MSKLVGALVAIASTIALGTGNLALAKGHKSHHAAGKCTKDGKHIKAKTEKTCAKMGGAWEAAGAKTEQAPAANEAPGAGAEQAPAGNEAAPAQ